MQLHNPQISSDKEITCWSAHCHRHCLQPTLLLLATTSMESLEDHAPFTVPLEYLDLKEAFGKTKASGFPPHLSCEFSIELLPGATPPHNRTDLLSVAEQHAMEENIQEAFQHGASTLPRHLPQPASSLWRRKGADSDPALITED